MRTLATEDGNSLLLEQGGMILLEGEGIDPITGLVSVATDAGQVYTWDAFPGAVAYRYSTDGGNSWQFTADGGTATTFETPDGTDSLDGTDRITETVNFRLIGGRCI